MINYNDIKFKLYKWYNIPGRKVYHAFIHCNDEHQRLISICGQSKKYHENQLISLNSNGIKCEQCMIYIITGIHDGIYKFFLGHTPLEHKVKKRKLWKEWLSRNNKLC